MSARAPELKRNPILSLLLVTLTSLPFTAFAANREHLERVTVNVARSVDGTIIACPNALKSATPDRQCVRAPHDPESVKLRLNRQFGGSLVTAWRAQSNGVYAYNYLKQDGEYVSIVVGPAPQNAEHAFMVLDFAPPRTQSTPSNSASGVRITPAPRTEQPSQDRSRSQAAAPPTKATPSAAPSNFRRELSLRAARMNGEDVRAVQNRLIEVAGMPRGSGGDGWYGPVTAATVMAFQDANGLPVTGIVDQVTWELLFSGRAKAFDARSVQAFRDRVSIDNP